MYSTVQYTAVLYIGTVRVLVCNYVLNNVYTSTAVLVQVQYMNYNTCIQRPKRDLNWRSLAYVASVIS